MRYACVRVCVRQFAANRCNSHANEQQQWPRRNDAPRPLGSHTPNAPLLRIVNMRQSPIVVEVSSCSPSSSSSSCSASLFPAPLFASSSSSSSTLSTRWQAAQVRAAPGHSQPGRHIDKVVSQSSWRRVAGRPSTLQEFGWRPHMALMELWPRHERLCWAGQLGFLSVYAVWAVQGRGGCWAAL